MTPLHFEMYGFQSFVTFDSVSLMSRFMAGRVWARESASAQALQLNATFRPRKITIKFHPDIYAAKFGHRCICISFASRSPIAPSAEETLHTSPLKGFVVLIQPVLSHARTTCFQVTRSQRPKRREITFHGHVSHKRNTA